TSVPQPPACYGPMPCTGAGWPKPAPGSVATLVGRGSGLDQRRRRCGASSRPARDRSRARPRLPRPTGALRVHHGGCSSASRVMRSPIRVLVIDDSATRQVLTAGLAADPAFEVVGSAADPYEASEKILRLLPDVVTLDVDLPRMNGVEFLRRLMPRFPLPVVMVSALTQRGNDISLQALDAGAIDVVTKPALDRAGAVERMLVELRTKLKIAAIADVGTWERGVATRTREIGVALEEPPEKLIAIGASTGGPEALKVLLTRLPARGPAVLVVQHMPPGFTQMFAERLDEVC